MSIEQDHESLTVLQWNVWYRADPVAIGEHLLGLTNIVGMPDVLCLQEVTEPTLDVMREVTGARSVSFFANRTHSDGTKEGQAMLSSSMSMTGLEQANFAVISRGGRAPFKGGKDSARVVQFASYEKAPRIIVANMHTSYPTPYSAISRWRERVALDNLFSDCRQTVAVGDLNSRPASRVVHTLSKHMVHLEPGSPTWSSAHVDGGKALIRRTIDHVFATADLDAHVQVLTPGPSDHTPLLVTVER